MVKYEHNHQGQCCPDEIKEEEMAAKSPASVDRAERGKRLLIYGMFSLVVVTIVAVFLTLWLITAPIGLTSIAVKTTVIVGLIAIAACVIEWFVYTKLVLSE
jgi:hypothetical protein